MRLILNSNFDWHALSRQVRKEQRNREAYSPTVSTYRWWARRSHALIGALIERGKQVLGPSIVVSDPMAGGGTVAIEAARRGLRVYAQDINPWAAFGLATTLQPVDHALVEKAANDLIAQLVDASRSLYSVGRNGDEIVTQLHVRTCLCATCKCQNFLFPTALVALDRRITSNPKTGWFGCPACGHTHQAAWPRGPEICPVCEFSYLGTKPDEKRIVRRIMTCAHCNTKSALSPESLRKGGWASALTLVADGRNTRVYPNSPPPRKKKRSLIAAHLERPIPPRGETSALLANGFRDWADLFPDRQMALLDKAFSALTVAEIPSPVRRRLLLSLVGFAEMAGYACRWDPKYRKVYEVTSNHHYSRLFLAAEINPAGSVGRGTLGRRFANMVSAARWFRGSVDAHVTCASSEVQPLPDNSVDLVVTDPPYYDSVQYAELSRLFRVFAQGLGLPWSNEVEYGEAVASRSLGCTHEEFISRLRGIFRETARTLKPTGRMLLTFHHTRTEAWEAVALALRESNWRIVSVAVVHSENEKDFAKNEKRAIAVDAVFECVLRKAHKTSRVTTALGAKSRIAQHILVMGAAVAAYVNGSPRRLRQLYLAGAKRRGLKSVMIS